MSLTSLEAAAETAVARHLQDSYEEGQFYHTVGRSLLTVNPFHLLKRNLESIPDDPQLLQKFCNIEDESLPTVHLYRYARNIRRIATEEANSQVVIFRGCRGSGKSEAMKGIIQYLVNADSHSKDASISTTTPHPLGSFENPFQLPSDSNRCGKAVAAALSVLDAFCSGGTYTNDTTTFCSRHVTLMYGSNGRLQGAHLRAFFPQMLSFGQIKEKDKDAPIETARILPLFLAGIGKKGEDYCISSTLKDTFLGVPGKEQLQELQAEFHHLSNTVVGSGALLEDDWEQVLKVVAACINLQSVALVGADSTIISSNTKV